MTLPESGTKVNGEIEDPDHKTWINWRRINLEPDIVTLSAINSQSDLLLFSWFKLRRSYIGHDIDFDQLRNRGRNLIDEYQKDHGELDDKTERAIATISNKITR